MYIQFASMCVIQIRREAVWNTFFTIDLEAGMHKCYSDT